MGNQSARPVEAPPPPPPPRPKEIKLLLLGDSFAGKTSLQERFVTGEHRTYSTTLGLDYKIVKRDVAGEQVDLTIWDTMGQERFRSIGPNYYRGAHAVLFCYSVDNRQSFTKIAGWLQEVNDTVGAESFVKVLIANKVDLLPRSDPRWDPFLAPRVVSTEEGGQLAKDMGMAYFEASAKTGLGVTEAFMGAATQAVQRKAHGEARASLPQQLPPQPSWYSRLTECSCTIV